MDKDGDDLTSTGSPFHMLGAAAANDRSPNATVRVLGADRRFGSEEERRARIGEYWCIMSSIYLGADPLRAL